MASILTLKPQKVQLISTIKTTHEDSYKSNLKFFNFQKGCLPQHLNKILCTGKLPKCKNPTLVSMTTSPDWAKLCLYGKKQIRNVLTKPAYHTYTNQTFP